MTNLQAWECAFGITPRGSEKRRLRRLLKHLRKGGHFERKDIESIVRAYVYPVNQGLGSIEVTRS